MELVRHVLSTQLSVVSWMTVMVGTVERWHVLYKEGSFRGHPAFEMII